MPFFSRSRRSKRSQPGSNHPLFQDQSKQKKEQKEQKEQKDFRKRSVTADYPRAAKPISPNRVRAASSARPANKAVVTKLIAVEKPNPGVVIPDVIPSHESQASVQVVNAQINTATTKATQEPATKLTQEPQHVLKDNLSNGNYRKKRTSSFTHSESEAVGTLDEVLRDFDSIDDNLNEITQEKNGAKTMETINDDIFTDEPRYSSISELKEKELTKSEAEIKAIDNPEDIYAKPIKTSEPTTPTEKIEINAESILNPSWKNEADEGPVVPPKRFVTEEHEINLSGLTKPSSLSQPLKETERANTNAEKSSSNRRPTAAMDSNNNYSLKRGKLSAPNEESTEDYMKPPPDYDLNGTMSSIGKSISISDDSFTRDNWTGSLSSSSGSRKEPKPIRPEVLDLIREKKKSEQPEGEPTHDGLVRRSFRLIIEASLKNENEIKSPESDYVAIKDEADKWLTNNERLRANSPPAKNYDSTATNSSASGSPQRKVLEPVNGSSKPKNESLKSDSTPSDPNGSLKSQSKSPQKEVYSEDENLVRLMETGIYPENTSGVVNGSQDSGWTYVPRALRMSFGQSWDGIRKDRRAWKSKEINTSTSHNARKGSKNLSNRLDEQIEQVEMLF